MSLLRIEQLTRNFGGLSAVSNVSLKIEKNELVGLIGPNGAGKTTLFNVLTGVYAPSSGRVMFSMGDKEIELSKLPPYKITRLGVARTFQNIRLFKELSVLDNVKIAMNHEAKYGLAGALLRVGKFYSSEAYIDEKARAFLKEVNLDDLNIAYQEERGSVKILIIEDSLSNIRKVIGDQSPLIFDILPLSLEELFIYEVGGEDDDIQKLIF